MVQISYRAYNSYYWSTIPLSNITKQNNEKKCIMLLVK